jgi:hypothetical protein
MGLRLFGGDVDAVTAHAAILRDGRLQQGKRRVRVRDAVPRKDRYYLKVLIMAERLLDGQRHLAI